VEVLDLNNPVNLCLPPPSFPFPISGAVAEHVNGKLLVCGGFSGDYLSSCFSLTDGEWAVETSMELNTNRAFSKASLVGNDWIVAGGLYSSFDISETAEHLNDDIWMEDLTLPSNFVSHCQVTVNSSYVFLSGGTESLRTYLLNWDTKEWERLDPFPGNIQTGITCGKVTLADGNEEVVAIWRGETFIFSMETLQWRNGPSFEAFSDTSTVQVGNSFMAVGGEGSIGVYYFNPESYEFEPFGRELLFERGDAILALVPNEIANC